MNTKDLPGTLLAPSSDHDTVIALTRENQALRVSNADLRLKIELLQEQYKLLVSLLYGKKSEKRGAPETSPLQPLLFDEPASAPVPDATPTTTVKAHPCRKRGRRPLPKNLPRIDVVIDVAEKDRVCECGDERAEIGREVTERLDIIPAIIQVERTIRIKRACRRCEGSADVTHGAVHIAPLPPQIIPQGIVTPGFLAHVVISKYADALPLYRQQGQLRRLGLDISRATLAKWVLQVAVACHTLYALLLDEVHSGPVINMDETPIQVLNEPGRANTTKSYMWVCRGGPLGQPVIIFHYAPTRAGRIAEKLLAGYSGYLQTDGYVGYETVGERKGITHLGCMSHVRRKFVDVQKGAGCTTHGVARSILDLIGDLYGVEREASHNNLTLDAIVALRAKKSRPVLDRIKALLDKYHPMCPPKSLLGQAINYALNMWLRLTIYLEHGFLNIDNNVAENAIRPLAVGRKNWLFAGSPAGADAAAIMFSIIETAKANGIEPYAYLRFLFKQLPLATSKAEIRALLPQFVDRSRLGQ
jgi:transposase